MLLSEHLRSPKYVMVLMSYNTGHKYQRILRPAIIHLCTPLILFIEHINYVDIFYNHEYASHTQILL